MQGPTRRLSHGRLLVIFAPVLVLLAATAMLALAAWLTGWYRAEMLLAAACTAAGAGVLAMFLLYRQIRERQATGRALQSVAARASDIAESAMDAIITVDASQQILLFNPAAEKVFGWPRAAVIGQPLDKLLPERFRAGHRGHIERFDATGVTARRMGAQTVLTGLRANGAEFPIEASISQHSEEGKKRFTVILRDISERLAGDALLRHSEARLRGILDSAMDAIITVDHSQHIVLFNAAAEAMFGCTRDEAIGAPLASFIPERFRGGHAEHVRRFGETRTASRRMGAQRIVTGLRRNGAGVPDRCVDLAARGRCRQVLYGDPARRFRAGPRRSGAAPVAGRVARTRRSGACRPGTGEEPHRPRAARRTGPIADRVADGPRVAEGANSGSTRQRRLHDSPRWKRCSSKRSPQRGELRRTCAR